MVQISKESMGVFCLVVLYKLVTIEIIGVTGG
jgi:hypothetical protein